MNLFLMRSFYTFVQDNFQLIVGEYQSGSGSTRVQWDLSTVHHQLHPLSSHITGMQQGDQYTKGELPAFVLSCCCFVNSGFWLSSRNLKCVRRSICSKTPTRISIPAISCRNRWIACLIRTTGDPSVMLEPRSPISTLTRSSSSVTSANFRLRSVIPPLALPYLSLTSLNLSCRKEKTFCRMIC